MAERDGWHQVITAIPAQETTIAEGIERRRPAMRLARTTNEGKY